MELVFTKNDPWNTTLVGPAGVGTYAITTASANAPTSEKAQGGSANNSPSGDGHTRTIVTRNGAPVAHIDYHSSMWPWGESHCVELASGVKVCTDNGATEGKQDKAAKELVKRDGWGRKRKFCCDGVSYTWDPDMKHFTLKRTDAGATDKSIAELLFRNFRETKLIIFDRGAPASNTAATSSSPPVEGNSKQAPPMPVTQEKLDSIVLSLLVVLAERERNDEAWGMGPSGELRV